MGDIRAYYERIIQLPEEEWRLMASYFRRRTWPKRSVIVKQGDTEKYLSFIETGIIRFYIPGEENDVTFNFGFAKEFTCAYDSFLTQHPSQYALQALTDVVAWQISYEDLQEVYHHTKSGNVIGRFISEKLFLEKSKRELSFLQFNAMQRYQNLFHERPDIVKFIPLKYIASYIGITPQGLSRIRRQIT